jgi:hypothetical protein
MLSVPTKAFRVKAAIALAALYVLCILAPSAAFALSNNPAVAHCLTEGHVGVHVHADKSHAHADATAHQHHDQGTAHRHHDGGTSQKPSGDDGKGSVANCCGLFSVVAIPGEPDLMLGPSTHASVLVPAPREALSGRGPDRLYRPPISLLSL